jgi:septal ring-binding cell division protein DamX
MLVTTWYTQVSPTATGNGSDPAATTEPGLAAGVAAGVALVVPVAVEMAPAGLLADAAADVPAAEPHPASATTAAPRKTARADVYLLMVVRTAQG